MKPGSLRPDLRELAWVTTWKLGTLGICRDYKGTMGVLLGDFRVWCLGFRVSRIFEKLLHGLVLSA